MLDRKICFWKYSNLVQIHCFRTAAAQITKQYWISTYLILKSIREINKWSVCKKRYVAYINIYSISYVFCVTVWKLVSSIKSREQLNVEYSIWHKFTLKAIFIFPLFQFSYFPFPKWILIFSGPVNSELLASVWKATVYGTVHSQASRDVL